MKKASKATDATFFKLFVIFKGQWGHWGQSSKVLKFHRDFLQFNPLISQFSFRNRVFFSKPHPGNQLTCHKWIIRAKNEILEGARDEKFQTIGMASAVMISKMVWEPSGGGQWHWCFGAEPFSDYGFCAIPTMSSAASDSLVTPEQRTNATAPTASRAACGGHPGNPRLARGVPQHQRFHATILHTPRITLCS